MKRIFRALYRAVITKHFSFRTYSFPGQPYDVRVHHRWVNRFSSVEVGHSVTNEDGTPWKRPGGHLRYYVG